LLQSGNFAATGIGAFEGQASAPPWGTNSPAPKFDVATTLVIVKGISEARLAGLVAVRITWITAILVCAVAILIGLISGTGSGNSSPQFPGFAFSKGLSDGRDSSHQSSESASFHPAAAMVGAAAHRDRNGRAVKGAHGKTHYNSGVPTRSGSQPEDSGGRTPVVTHRPKPPQGDPAEAPQAPSGAPTKPPQAPPVASPNPPPAPPVSPSEPSPEPPEPSPAPPVIPAP
jgi:hypothetical protein